MWKLLVHKALSIHVQNIATINNYRASYILLQQLSMISVGKKPSYRGNYKCFYSHKIFAPMTSTSCTCQAEDYDLHQHAQAAKSS